MARNVVRVTWEDSTIPAAGWLDRGSVVDRKYRKAKVRCDTYGVVIADDKFGMTLASTFHGGQVAGVVIIPRRQIVRVKIVAEK